MIAVFAHTGGLTGAEVAVAGGTSAVGQRVLEALLGDQAVRTLAAQAREDLLERARGAAGRARRTATTTLLAPAPPRGPARAASGCDGRRRRRVERAR